MTTAWQPAISLCVADVANELNRVDPRHRLAELVQRIVRFSHLTAPTRSPLQLLTHQLIRELVRRDVAPLGLGLERLEVSGFR